ncbi:MAG: DUF4430 domain-containing protein [Clostridia bacterium]|nr:DUF4430 domain-containing protein [Clostridia bacterium]
MKKTIKILSGLFLIAALCLPLNACREKSVEEPLWENASYTEDAEFGSGSKTVYVEVKAEDKSVTFKINTDKEILGEALLEHNLIAGEKGPYGLYVKVVNGITADYDINQSYWAFNKNGESMQTGVDGAGISGGEHFELVYTK